MKLIKLRRMNTMIRAPSKFLGWIWHEYITRVLPHRVFLSTLTHFGEELRVL